MKNLLSTSLAVVLLAFVATGIDRFFKIGTLGDSPFWKVLIYIASENREVYKKTKPECLIAQGHPGITMQI